MEKRYTRMIQNGKPRYYIDILRNPLYDTDKYPVTFQDTMIIDPLFLPVVFTGKLYVDKPPRIDDTLALKLSESPTPTSPNVIKNPFAPDQYDLYLRNRIYWDAILADPSIVKYQISQLSGSSGTLNPTTIEVKVFEDLFKVDNTPDFSTVAPPVRFATKRKYWIINGTHKLQLSQAYISENWYKGGVGNTNFLSDQTLTINYKKGKIQNNNEIRWNLSLYTNPNDTLRETKIGNDLFRIYSTLGFKAFGDKWSYTSTLEFKTQLFNNYVENTNTKRSAVLAPMYLTVGVLGMGYQLNKTFPTNKYKTLGLSIDVSPFSLKYTYVRNSDEINPVPYGIPAGEKDILALGSTINSKLTFNFNRGVSFSSRFKCFTDYDKVEIESENDLNLAINRYFSTRIYLLARFDDAKGIVRDAKWGYWQINQLLSFGLSYQW